MAKKSGGKGYSKGGSATGRYQGGASTRYGAQESRGQQGKRRSQEGNGRGTSRYDYSREEGKERRGAGKSAYGRNPGSGYGGKDYGPDGRFGSYGQTGRGNGQRSGKTGSRYEEKSFNRGGQRGFGVDEERRNGSYGAKNHRDNGFRQEKTYGGAAKGAGYAGYQREERKPYGKETRFSKEGAAVSQKGKATNLRKEDNRPQRDDVLLGRNAVMAAIKSGRPIERILIQKNASGSIHDIFRLADELRIPYSRVDKSVLDIKTEGGPHQGVVAYTAAHTYATMEDIQQVSQERKEDPFVVLLDGVEDPHNLGAIMRSAECAGVHGIVVPKHDSVGLTATVAKTSAGAIEYMRCARVNNLTEVILKMKDQGIWTVAVDMDGENYTDVDLTGPVALVIGSEGRGISRRVKEHCDRVVSIPMKGSITSLNASNAAALVIYEVLRQREAKKEQ